MPTLKTSQSETAAGLAQLEGYLAAQTYRKGARVEAEAFAERLPWLTTAQHEDVVRAYTEDRMALTRRVLEGVVERCSELRGEYTARYEQLRRRLFCHLTVIALAALALGVPVEYLALR